MTIKITLKEEIENRRVQLDKLRTALEEQEESDDMDSQRSLALLKRAEMSFTSAEARLSQGIYSDAVYLFAQGCWNLGCAHGTSRRL